MISINIEVKMYPEFDKKSILVLDIECDSLDVASSKMKWFGAYSYLHNEYYLLQFPKDKKDIINLLKEHKIHVGFNIKEFDNPIIDNNLRLEENIFEYKVIIDLLEMSAPKSGKNYGFHRKNRLAMMGYKLKNFTLKNIIEELKLDKDIGSKGDIDYHIFQKDDWTPEELSEIKKYLKQDIDLTMLLFQWYNEQFKPLKKFLPKKEQDNLLYLKSSLAVLAYNIICNKAGLPVEFGEKTVSTQSFEGGHHIENKKELITGNIIEVDFTSAYPHAIMQGNLCSPAKEGEEGWDGDKYYKLDGKYNNKQQGKVELALKDIFLERLKAKKEKDIPKDKSYKIIINSFYGTLGNPVFKSIYNRNSVSDTTSIVRTWLKKLAKTLNEAGYECLYGFTDSVFVLVPPPLTKETLLYQINSFIKDATSHISFPMDTFKMGVEEEIKMIWFVAKNCYLFVTKNNEVKYKSTLLNTNTPPAVMKLFETYMKPIIISKLDIPFTKKELEAQIKNLLEIDLGLGAQEYKVNELTEYKVKTSLQYQISQRYGQGRHSLIPNRKGIGIGLSKNTKRIAGLRYCTIGEFKEAGLKTNDIDLTHLLSHLKPFYERNEIKVNINEKYKQKTL
jgi:DNA polymerase elongation subunit (family B)